MKVILLIAVALSVVLVSGGRSDGCRAHFRQIFNHPILSTQNPTNEFIRERRSSLIKLFIAIWQDKCSRELDILFGANRDSAIDISSANEFLQRSMGVLEEAAGRRQDLNERFNGAWIYYINEVRQATISAFGGVKSNDCKTQVDKLQTDLPKARNPLEASRISETIFDIIDKCLGKK
eukprot:TRINITY_DN1389_c0_g1_i3.p1 TRINITY_DN1389_c0_g1~~TRINITY_DN1389_c0_g1_i3.p1  ORF type:complete len:178 (+),score=36.19 TRINITY_DN1389_c0_g1_i3:125-658(+)